MISFTVQHVLILRLVTSYHFQSTRTINNIFFLVSAEKRDRQQLSFYDFVRTGFGAHSVGVQRMLDDLKREKLLTIDTSGVRVTNKGQLIYTNLGASLIPFSEFCNLCQETIECFDGDPEQANRRIFYHLLYRRARMGNRIFQQ